MKALRLIALIALLPLAALVPTLAGALVAIILLLGWSPGLRDLLIALRPLLLPLLAVALLGALGDGLSSPLKVLIGVVAVLLVVPWSAAGWVAGGTVVDDTSELLGNSIRAILATLALVGLAILALELLPDTRSALGDSSSRFEELGGPPIAFAFCALIAWLVAFALRVLGFMRSPGRALVAVAFGVTLALALIETDVTPFPALGWDVVGAVAVAGGVLFVALLVIETLHEPGFADAPSWLAAIRDNTSWATNEYMSGALTETLYARGLNVAIASMVVLLLALGTGWFDVHRSSSDVGAANGSIGGAEPDRSWAELSPRELGRVFMPVFVFSSEQRWLPQRVDDYVRAAPLVSESDGVARTRLPRACKPGRLDPCYDLRCPSVDDRCAGVQDFSARHGRYEDARSAVYVRVVYRDRRPADDSPAVFDERIRPFGARLSVLVQYWIFYPFDEWTAPVLAGRVVQQHGGDWENVTVGLADDEPLFVAYSEHCGGRWMPWGQVRVADDPVPRTHPLVAVAVGSHANYVDADDVRSPSWTSCSHVPTQSVELLSYVWNVRDRTRSDWELLPQGIEVVDARTPPMTFPGRWGEHSTTEFVGFRSRQISVAGGPPTPSRQALWQHPLQQIFCDRYWHGPRRRGACIP